MSSGLQGQFLSGRIEECSGSQKSGVPGPEASELPRGPVGDIRFCSPLQTHRIRSLEVEPRNPCSNKPPAPPCLWCPLKSANHQSNSIRLKADHLSSAPSSTPISSEAAECHPSSPFQFPHPEGENGNNEVVRMLRWVIHRTHFTQRFLSEWSLVSIRSYSDQITLPMKLIHIPSVFLFHQQHLFQCSPTATDRSVENQDWAKTPLVHQGPPDGLSRSVIAHEIPWIREGRVCFLF